MAEICRFAGEPDAAIAHCREALELDPNFLFAHINLAATYEQEQMYAEAVDETIWCMRSGGTSEAIVAEHRDAFAKSGWPGFCRTRIAHNPNAPLLQTISYLQLGEPDRAIAALQKGCERRDFFMIFAGVDPRLAPLRSDPRFVEIARTIGVS
jgi:tetratricopeptide (TPR) repeat protein